MMVTTGKSWQSPGDKKEKGLCVRRRRPKVYKQRFPAQLKKLFAYDDRNGATKNGCPDGRRRVLLKMTRNERTQSSVGDRKKTRRGQLWRRQTAGKGRARKTNKRRKPNTIASGNVRGGRRSQNKHHKKGGKGRRKRIPTPTFPQKKGGVLLWA